MTMHTGKGHVFAYCCLCLMHFFHTLSYPVLRDEGVFHWIGIPTEYVCVVCCVSVYVSVVSEGCVRITLIK